MLEAAQGLANFPPQEPPHGEADVGLTHEMLADEDGVDAGLLQAEYILPTMDTAFAEIGRAHV